MEENKSILERTVDMVISSVQMGGKETHSNLLSVNNEETTKELLGLTKEQVLLDLKYVTRENKADHPYWFRYRFYTSPVLMDHERSWYNGMMRANSGDISTVAIQERIDSGEWRKPDN